MPMATGWATTRIQIEIIKPSAKLTFKNRCGRRWPGALALNEPGKLESQGLAQFARLAA
jgi:hypothetical protein